MKTITAKDIINILIITIIIIVNHNFHHQGKISLWDFGLPPCPQLSKMLISAGNSHYENRHTDKIIHHHSRRRHYHRY